MQDLKTYIQEASRSEKKNNERFAKSLWVKGKKIAGINSFAILTSENANSLNPNELSGQERRDALKINKKNKRDLLTYLKQNHLKFTPVQGKFGGTTENSYMIFNISFEQAKKLSGKFEQTSFFYCRPNDKGDVISEYWEKEDDSKPYSSVKNDYVCKETTTAWTKLSKDTKDNYSVIGGDFKYTIDLKLFESVNDEIINSAKEIVESLNNTETVQGVISRAYTRIDSRANSWRMKLNGYI